MPSNVLQNEYIHRPLTLSSTHHQVVLIIVIAQVRIRFILDEDTCPSSSTAAHDPVAVLAVAAGWIGRGGGGGGGSGGGGGGGGGGGC